MAHQSVTLTDVEKDVSRRIHGFILEKLLAGEEPINLTDTTPLVSGGIIDSLNSLRVGLFLEKAFAVRLAPEELANPENLETIAAMSKLIVSRMPAADGLQTLSR